MYEVILFTPVFKSSENIFAPPSGWKREWKIVGSLASACALMRKAASQNGYFECWEIGSVAADGRRLRSMPSLSELKKREKK